MSEKEALDSKCSMGDDIHVKDEKAPISNKPKMDGDTDDQDEQESSNSPWANELPNEIIEEILECLPLSHYANFIGVCQPWKDVAMPQYLQPYLVSLPYNRRLVDSCMVNVKNDKVLEIRHPVLDERYCVGSSHGWLILKKEKSTKVSVMNLFNGARFDLPTETLILYSGNVFLSSSPLSGNCTVLVIGKFISGFAFCKIGDSSWTVERYQFLTQSSEGVTEYLEQAVTLGENFYVLTSLGRLAAIENVHCPRMITIVNEDQVVPARKVLFKYFKYLLQSERQLLVVFLSTSGLVRAIDHVEVFRYDFESDAWLQMEKLDGRTLFVGFNSSFSVRSVKDYIYFPDNLSDGWRMFDMEMKRFTVPQCFDWRYSSDLQDSVWLLPTLEYPASV